MQAVLCRCKIEQQGLQRRLHSAPRVKRETRIVPIGGRCV